MSLKSRYINYKIIVIINILASISEENRTKKYECIGNY